VWRTKVEVHIAFAGAYSAAELRDEINELNKILLVMY
jgi:hypothetical protein